jgi:hypothetical protein
MADGGPTSHKAAKAGYPRAVNSHLPRVIARESMTLTEIFAAGQAAGSEATGVWAVFAEGRKRGSVIDRDGRYVGEPAVQTQWALRNGARLENETLPVAVYDVFKTARGGLDLEQALARVHALGQASVPDSRSKGTHASN